MAIAQLTTVRVTREFASPPAKVFDAWLDPDMIGQWMFGPSVRDEEIVHIELDARENGAFSFLVHRNGEDIDHLGRYRQIDRPRRLVFTWSVPRYAKEDSLVTVDMAPHRSGPGTKLTLAHEHVLPDYAKRTEAGWTKMLDALAKALSET
jgi:uncharacterized protein YndB with AHSA1/START domain